MPPDALAAALSRMARAVSETLELREVFARVAEAAADVLPFEEMGVVRLEPPDTLTHYTYVGAEDAIRPPRTLRFGDFSPELRPYLDRPLRLGDAQAVLDPAFLVDRDLAEKGTRALIFQPLRRGEQLTGFVGVLSSRAGVFTAEHETALQSIAQLLVVALEHERLWNLDAERRRRLDAIDSQLLTMAPVRDLREIFQRISAAVQPVLPHDRLMLTSLSSDRTVITMDALSGDPVPDLPTSKPADERYLRPEGIEHEIVSDIELCADHDTGCQRMSRLLEVRSALRIPLSVEGGRVGALFFFSKTPNRYTEEDLVVARRVADHVSLALSHHRLLDEERAATEARQRATQLEERVAALKEELASSRGFRRVVGESAPWREVLEHAAKVAVTETTVLLTGESGTGKEVVARFVHRGSPRADGPFVALNCAALSETLLESELFGHEKGAFTGANAARAGSLEQAAGGVLFLDEVGEMSRTVQAKLLRVLQEREFQRLGATKPMRADVRVLAATNRDLSAAIARGEFREDLYYRLHVFEIRLPPLRERRDDVLPLAEAFLEELAHVVGRPAAGISREARELLLAYAWPGNVRELRNVLERATILCDGGLIAAEHLPRELGKSVGAARHLTSAPSAPPDFNLETAERNLILQALEVAGNNRSQAARLLGLARPQLYHRLRKYGIDADRVPSDD